MQNPSDKLRQSVSPDKAEPQPEESCEIDRERGTGTLNAATREKMSESELMEYFNLDPRQWQIVKLKIGSWNGFYKTADGHEVVDLYTHRADIKRRFSDCQFAAIDAMMQDRRPLPNRKPKPQKRGDLMYVISLFDAHFGKYAWAPETGEDYDLDIARHVYRQAFIDLIDKVKKSEVSRVIYPIGQDFGHFDNVWGQTTKGTTVDYDSRWPMVYEAMGDAVQWAIQEARKVAPVEIHYSGGNHDRLVSYTICSAMKRLFLNDPTVDVTRSTDPKTRHYVQHGKTAIGIAHGDGAKLKDLPLIMSRECEFWSECDHHEILTGHFHQEKVLESVGIKSRILPSLSATDWYHYHNGWVKNKRAAVGLLYHKENGIDGIEYAHVSR